MGRRRAIDEEMAFLELLAEAVFESGDGTGYRINEARMAELRALLGRGTRGVMRHLREHGRAMVHLKPDSWETRDYCNEQDVLEERAEVVTPLLNGKERRTLRGVQRALGLCVWECFETERERRRLAFLRRDVWGEVSRAMDRERERRDRRNERRRAQRAAARAS